MKYFSLALFILSTVMIIQVQTQAAGGPSKNYENLDSGPCFGGFMASCGRMISNAQTHARAWCSGSGGLRYEPSFSCASENGGLFCRVTGRIECNGNVGSSGGSSGGSGPSSGAWYAVNNPRSNADKDAELRNIIHGNFTRISLNNAVYGDSWNSLCQSIGKRCIDAVDWEGNHFACTFWAFDGTRVAKCQ